MRTILLTLIILFPLLVFSQTGQSVGTAGKGPAGGAYKIKGTIVDADSGIPLEYVTASLLQEGDSTLTGGSVTDTKGYFEIGSKPGRYIIKLQYISYNTEYVSGITVNGSNNTVDIGSISLAPSVETLSDVVITAQKSQMEIALDKRIFNVGKDLSNNGTNASDILNNIPSVSVDIDGNVSLRGNQNVRILIDGKPSGLVGLGDTNGLKQLQGNLIERVEVVTNPSARYEAEGMTGIINIILKKEKNKGLNGAFTLNTGYPHNHGVSVNMSLRKKWINLFTNYGVGYQNAPGKGYTYQQFIRGDSTYYTDVNRAHTRGGIFHNIRFGTELYAGDNNTFTISALYRFSDQQNNSTIRYEDFNPFRVLLQDTYRHDNELEDEQNHEYSLRYQRTFAHKNQSLTADLQWREGGEIEDSKQKQGPYDLNGEELAADLFQRSLNDEKETNLLFQADYVHPISRDGKLEVGLRGNLREIGNNYLVEQQDSISQWYSLPGFTNDFTYEENIYAAYATFGNKMKQFSYQLGLRAEVSDILTHQAQTNETTEKNYTNLFPSAHVSYEFKNKNALQASYSRRLNRPRFRSLNPFSSYSDARNIRAGNPDLNPQFTDSYEVGFLKNWAKATLFNSVYYRYTTGAFGYITTVEEDITYSRPQNLNTEKAYGVEFTYSQDLAEWWKMNGSANLYYQRIDGTIQGEYRTTDAYTMSTRWMSNMTLWKSLEFQTSVSYRAPETTIQGRRKSYFVTDLGLSRDIIKKKGTISLNVRDLFNTRKFRYETFTPNYIAETSFQWMSRQAILSFTYRLNQQKRRERSDRGGDFGGDDGF